MSAVQEAFPALRLRGAERAITFYKDVFGAEELFRSTEPGGRIGHAELRLGKTVLYLPDEYPEYGIFGPGSPGGSKSCLHLRTGDADAVVARAVAAGAELIRPLANQFYGERSGTVLDPFGHEWTVSHPIEDVSFEEMQRRFTEMSAGS